MSKKKLFHDECKALLTEARQQLTFLKGRSLGKQNMDPDFIHNEAIRLLVRVLSSMHIDDAGPMPTHSTIEKPPGVKMGCETFIGTSGDIHKRPLAPKIKAPSEDREDIVADIRNKLTPFWALCDSVNDYGSNRLLAKEFLDIIKKTANTCDKNKKIITDNLKKLTR